MNSEVRKQKITQVINDKSNERMTGVPFRYRGQPMSVSVYQIPLEFLVYNKYNGRIAAEVLSYEKENGPLDPEHEDDIRLLEDFLYKSKEDRNEATMKSLRQIGQQRYGIITADGIIIDGNRRAMLLNRLYHKREELKLTYKEVEQCKYFLAIVLPDSATEKDIQQLETIYQMGEDDKLDYDAIAKYLKCKRLKELGFSEADIAEFMGMDRNSPKSITVIRERLNILKLMEEFLAEYEYDGIYTRLERTEGQFVDLYKYLESYEKEKKNVADSWNYSKSDISDLKTICFDYIRARYEGKEFRDLAGTGLNGSIFFDENLWKSFLKEHQEKISVRERSIQELRESAPEMDLSILLKRRDEEWSKQVKGCLEGNLRKHRFKLENKRSKDKPLVLLERALSALRLIDMDQEEFLSDPKTPDLVKEIGDIAWQIKKKVDRR